MVINGNFLVHGEIKMDTISNDNFRAAISSIINGWFKKWRDHQFANQAEWDSCISELTKTAAPYDSTLIRQIGAALVEEIERRQP